MSYRDDFCWRVYIHQRYWAELEVFLFPLFIAGITSVLIVDGFFLGFILELNYIFDARYFIPITGMILGNSLNHNIVGLSSYFKGLS